jgi:uncharacterized protein (UPF0335 family)
MEVKVYLDLVLVMEGNSVTANNKNVDSKRDSVKQEIINLVKEAQGSGIRKENFKKFIELKKHAKNNS